MKDEIKVFICGFISALAVMVIAISVMSMTGVIDLNSLMFKNRSSVYSKDIQSKVKEISSLVDSYYTGDIDEKTVEDSICSGLISGLGDKYAAYYNADTVKSLKSHETGEYIGIGISVSLNATTGAIDIVEIEDNSPAKKAGLKVNDEIYYVDGTKVDNTNLESVIASIGNGKIGTTVKIKLKRAGVDGYLEYNVIRQKLENDTVEYTMLDDNTGYVRVTSFKEVTVEQFDKAIDAITEAKAKYLIIDLRNNGGGLLESAVDMLDRLLPKELVVYTENKSGLKQSYYADDTTQVNIPMAILVNGGTASASEIFSGALQDYDKAILVGTKTYGKGIVQTSYSLNDKTVVKFTTAKYYTPKGRNIQGTGFEPDVENEAASTINISSEKVTSNVLLEDDVVKSAIDAIEK